MSRKYVGDYNVMKDRMFDEDVDESWLTIENIDTALVYGIIIEHRYLYQKKLKCICQERVE